MKGKHDKDLCDRCRTWKTDCKEFFGRDLCPLCHECEEIELKLLRQAEIPQPDWSKAMTDFNERIERLAELEKKAEPNCNWAIESDAIESTEAFAHHVLYDDGLTFSVCEDYSADPLSEHARFIVALRNEALPLLREMQNRINDLEDDYLYASSTAQDQIAENERLREGIKDVAAKFAEMEKLRSQFYTEKEQSETALLFANREVERLREGIGRALEQGRNAELIECVAELEALQNDA